ncbi:hypothetical protein SAY86_016509 [Trapa natans]|uniref:U3 snoRNP-associated protein-like EMB2271 n=1 Tax=Trapa natans TaxID=22666 RepID=A0AAN7LLJ7_TRANT|nr:hypothetical protein SAY86_016509 [Trapa natans]
MKSKGSKKKDGTGAGGGKAKGKNRRNPSIKEDSFFSHKKRRKMEEDEDIVDEMADSDEEDGDFEAGPLGEAEETEFDRETPGEKRQRMAKAYLDKFRDIVNKENQDDDGSDKDEESDKEGLRDSLVSKYLMQEQLEESGRVRRLIASRVEKPSPSEQFNVLVKHKQSVTAVSLSDDDLKGFSASKDGTILQWDVNSGKGEKYLWPSEEILRSHGTRDPQGQATKQSKQVLALAVSSDGRYLASGGLDRHVHLWDTRTREHVQAFPGHRGPVSCLTFRQGTSELFSGSFDRTIKIWNSEDRAYISTLFGHQSEVLTIDCLRKERVLTVGRDRTMQLFKIPEESRIVFRAPASSLECCCFINNDEYITGSDDGGIELWSMLRKKPIYIVKNAHSSTYCSNLYPVEGGRLENGHIENGEANINNCKSSSAHSWVGSVTVCRGSDLVASGAGNGCVRLWTIGSETKDILSLFDLPLAGFVNSLAFAKSGKFLVAGVGQEPRLGRWGRLKAATNGVAVHSFKLS